jgi:cytochrome bd-type quinol oxidase subunit 2
LAWALKKQRIWVMRLSVGAQVLAILVGWWTAHYPNILKTEGGILRLEDVSAPFVTQLWLVVGLCIVLSLVVPLLVVLYRVFDKTRDARPSAAKVTRA